MSKIGNTIPILTTLWATLWEHNSMHRALEISIRPVTQKIADIDKNRRTRIIFGPRRKYRDRCPRGRVTVILLAIGHGRRWEDFESRLTRTLKQQRYRAIIRMSPCSYVDFRLEIDRTWDGRVVKQSKCTAARTTNVTGRKPGGATMIGRNLASLADIAGQDIC
jgi:hypothetical protein